MHNGYILEEYIIVLPVKLQATLIRYLLFYDNELNVTSPKLLVALTPPDIALIESESYINEPS